MVFLFVIMLGLKRRAVSSPIQMPIFYCKLNPLQVGCINPRELYEMHLSNPHIGMKLFLKLNNHFLGCSDFT